MSRSAQQLTDDLIGFADFMIQISERIQNLKESPFVTFAALAISTANLQVLFL